MILQQYLEKPTHSSPRGHFSTGLPEVITGVVKCTSRKTASLDPKIRLIPALWVGTWGTWDVGDVGDVGDVRDVGDVEDMEDVRDVESGREGREGREGRGGRGLGTCGTL